MEGHWEGADRVEDFLKWCMELAINTVTLYSFSTENFGRDEDEVREILRLFEKSLRDVIESDTIHRHRVRVRALGRVNLLPEHIQELIREVEEATKDYGGYYLNMALA